ncbi:MAG: PQQ-binding-like beta-propeller repeat protein [Halobacteriota archaeon]
MRRRNLMRSAAALAAGTTGCLHEPPAEGAQQPLWRYDVGARVEAAFDGRVLGREDWRQGGTGGVVALDADEGERLWRYGETHGYSTYTRLEFDDTGVYFGWGDDAIGSGEGEVYALDFDGGERWKADVGSVYSPPVAREGVVYVGSDRGSVHAFDAANGERLWSTDVEDGAGDPSVEAVEAGVVYVAGDDVVHALDASNGDAVWRYGEDVRAHALEVDAGRVYLTEYGRTAAVEDGDELWSRELDGNDRLRGLSHGNLYVGDVYALDPSDGETRWRVDGGGEPAFADDAVYLGGERLRRVTPEGDVEWTEGFDDVDEVERIRAVDGGVYAVAGYEDEDELHRVSDAGDVERSVDVDGTVTGYVVDDAVYVGTIEDVKAYER